MNDLRITNNALGFAAVAGLASVCLQGAAYGEGSEFPDGSVSITSLPLPTPVTPLTTPTSLMLCAPTPAPRQPTSSTK